MAKQISKTNKSSRSVFAFVLQKNIFRDQTELISYEAASMYVCMYVYVLAVVLRLENRIFCALYYIVICGLSGSAIFFLTINTWKILKCGAGEGWRRSVGPIM